MKEVADGIYTDGSCRGNPGPGGWAWVEVVNGFVVREAWGSATHTTNNRMELAAVIKALRSLDNESNSTIWIDSRMVILLATKLKNLNNERPNLNYLRLLVQQRELHPNVKYEWVKGHNGNPGNERADLLAAQASLYKLKENFQFPNLKLP